MTVETWLAFVAASGILLLISGPTILLVVSYALGQGWRAALPMALGVALGDFTAMTLSMLGVGALLAFANAAAYTFVASRARSAVQDARTMVMVNKVGGSLLIGAGIATATLRTTQP